MKTVTKRILIAVAALLSVGIGVLGWFAVPNIRLAIAMQRHIQEAAPREPIAVAAWTKAFGNPEAVLGRFPVQQDDEVARRLCSLTLKLGIRMTPPPTRNDDLLRPGSPISPVDQTVDVHDAIHHFVDQALGRESTPLELPSEKVRGFLSAHSSEIDDIVALLAESQPPRWRMEVNKGVEAPVPNLLGQLRLQRLLVAEALASIEDGRDAVAGKIFRASRTLNASIRERPEVISQLVAISIARMQVGLARWLKTDPEVLSTQIADHDYRSALIDDLALESFNSWKALRPDHSLMMIASHADFLDMRRRTLVEIKNAPVGDGPLETSAAKFPPDWEPLSYGEILGVMSGNEPVVVRRADRLIFDTELTTKILEAKALRNRLGRWPQVIPGIETSQFPNGRWNYSVTPNGHMKIVFSRELHWIDEKSLSLPSRYESD
jgi:hypothetical protein